MYMHVIIALYMYFERFNYSDKSFIHLSE